MKDSLYLKRSSENRNINRLPAEPSISQTTRINCEQSQHLSDTRCKRLVGVQKQTFEAILTILETAYAHTHRLGGRKPKLALQDILMATLRYLCGYRTYGQIAADFGIHESNLIRRSKWVEQVPVENGFDIGSREIKNGETVLIDAAEIKVCRPEKQHLNDSGKKKSHTAKVQIITAKHGEILHFGCCTERQDA